MVKETSKHLNTTRQSLPVCQQSKRVINLKTELLLESQENHLTCTIFLLTLQGKLIKLSMSIKLWKLMFPLSQSNTANGHITAAAPFFSNLLLAWDMVPMAPSSVFSLQSLTQTSMRCDVNKRGKVKTLHFCR